MPPGDKLERVDRAMARVNTAANVVLASTAAITTLRALSCAAETRRNYSMAGHSIVRAREQTKRLHSRLRSEIESREHTMTAFVVSGGIGMAEARGYRLPTVLGVDGTLAFGFISLFAGDFIGARGGKICQSVADGLLSIGAYKMGRHYGGREISGVGDVGDAAADARAMDALLSST